MFEQLKFLNVGSEWDFLRGSRDGGVKSSRPTGRCKSSGVNSSCSISSIFLLKSTDDRGFFVPLSSSSCVPCTQANVCSVWWENRVWCSTVSIAKEDIQSMLNYSVDPPILIAFHDKGYTAPWTSEWFVVFYLGCRGGKTGYQFI